MKNAIIALVLFAVSLSTFADDPRRPGRHGRNDRAPRHHRGPVVVRHRPIPPVVIRPRPIPRPMPHARMCQVVMTDRVNRVVRRYNARTDFNGMCREGLRQCNYDLNRMGMWGYRCATTRW